jgi:hypothetical protein
MLCKASTSGIRVVLAAAVTVTVPLPTPLLALVAKVPPGTSL